MSMCEDCKFQGEINHSYSNKYTITCNAQVKLPACMCSFELPKKYPIIRLYKMETESYQYFIELDSGYKIEITECNCYEKEEIVESNEF